MNKTDWTDNLFSTYQSVVKDCFCGQLASIKEQSWKNFERLGWPTTKSEEWKYTNISGIIKEGFVCAEQSESSISFTKTLEGDSVRILLTNGIFQSIEGEQDVRDLTVGSLKALQESLPKEVKELVHSRLNSLVGEQSLAFLNTCLFNDLVLVYVPRNCEITTPVHIKSQTTESSEVRSAFPRILVIAEEGSNLTIFEEFSGDSNSKNITNSVTEVFVAENAHVNYFKLQAESPSASHFGFLYIHQLNSSTFHGTIVNTGSQIGRNEVLIAIDGENVESTINGLNVLSQKQHVDNATVINHKKPNSFSSELFKGIYNGSSKGVFSGTIIVDQDAQKTNAYQSNQSILLSDNANSSSRPQLKIWADDVKCSHGATVGQLDEDALFYLKSRGINESEAKKLLITAFVYEVLTGMKNQTVRSYLEQFVENKLTETIF